MQGKLSRRRIAEYVASRYTAGADLSKLMDEVAAYLIETNRTRESVLVIRMIEDALSDHGVVTATVTSAYPLDEAAKSAVKSMIGARELHIREVTDPSVIGGIRVETASEVLDATIKHRLALLSAAKI